MKISVWPLGDNFGYVTLKWSLVIYILKFSCDIVIMGFWPTKWTLLQVIATAKHLS